MTEYEIKKITDLNTRLLLILGYGTSIILEMGKYMPVEQKEGIYWFIEAVENAVYLDKPLPPIPKR